MQQPDVEHIFPTIADRKNVSEYNWRHFRTKHVVSDLLGTVQKRGVQPGEFAPDFSLESVAGRHVRLSELRGRPVLLRFGSTT